MIWVGKGSPWDDFDMLLALRHQLEYMDSARFKSKKQYKTFIESMIDYLLKNHDERIRFLEYGGNLSFAFDYDTGKVVGMEKRD